MNDIYWTGFATCLLYCVYATQGEMSLKNQIIEALAILFISIIWPWAFAIYLYELKNGVKEAKPQI